MTLFDGISSRRVETPRLSVTVLERDGDDPSTPADRTVVFVHGTVGSSLFWQEILQDLPSDLRVLAVDLRGYGGTENAPVDATRGVRDFSDDLAATLDTIGIRTAHLVGWSLGAAVILQYALEHPALSLTLEAPISPYGFGGTRRDGTRLTPEDAGTGGGTANPDFVRRLAAGDSGDEAETSPRSMFRAGFVASGYRSDHEDVWVAAMLATSTAGGNYPGDSVRTDAWPGFAAGTTGVLNALAPKHFDLSGIVDLAEKPPLLWVHGEVDAIISDASVYEPNGLGSLGILPDWPGDDIAPPQPMVSQTRDVLDAYAAAGGDVVEIALPGVGHSPHLEAPAKFRHALLTRIGYVGTPADPAPTTEAIIIRSAD
ncbi:MULTISPECIES: alpha/beta fold hydrolase [Microbacterium]|uniref:Alpha/beta fold hydrolase n=1 Tax=Microbacterium wangchenii TaxID=2541726 RepID=A0ABX5SVN7_9MICO|nr:MULTISPECIES: alpha/beta hydrolase [Microbacterium]MCK6067179.1 alpha/beta hydrolase [Microbacterium sp. EYE_512]QBR89867.1 alpha/beta fold hydrolase [Microbacterium wangchenii]TFV85275.1 alpha/beta fold hydrolase [Microbacterium sp. dk485]TXK16536.1 alpha/beta hydrolase [Microbacterium wangchenii]